MLKSGGNAILALANARPRNQRIIARGGSAGRTTKPVSSSGVRDGVRINDMEFGR